MDQVKKLQTAMAELTKRRAPHGEVKHVVLNVDTPLGTKAEGELLERGTVCTAEESKN